jgi:dipeptidyl aminopeptidase/acylaminoacyl peptidase
MSPEDLASLEQPSDPRLSPDGSRVAFVVSTPDLEEDRTTQRIWFSDANGVGAVSDGPADRAPRWSPDGSRLAFLRQEGDSKAQLHVVDLDEEAVVCLTEFDLGVEAIEWSPNGSHLIAVGVSYTDTWAELDEKERDRRPKRIMSVPYMSDNRGPVHDRHRHLWLIDPSGDTEPRCLTPGDFDEETPAWSPDGRKIVFITDRDPKRGLRSGNDVYEVDIETGELWEAAPRGFWNVGSYNPDGTLHLLGSTNPQYPGSFYLYRRETDGSLTDLTGHLDRSSVSLSAGPATIVWREGKAIVGYEDSGSFGVIMVSPDGSTDTLVDGQQVVNGFDASSSRLVTTSSRWDSPGEVFSYGDGEQLTDLNGTDLGLVDPVHFRVNSDGYDIDVWVYLPEGDEKIPLLLNIHGGPASQYGFGFFDEFQIYVGAGYGVVACNPRGSSGRGAEFVGAVKGEAWGVVDLVDIRAAVTEALTRFPRLDESRMGLMGGSYGGFMTAWMIGLEDRWKSAVVERALISWTSFNGTSDIAGVFAENYLQRSYPNSWDSLWTKSPLSLVESVSTPTLVLHSENDYRCPIEQAEQYFTALLRNGIPAEFVRFPGEGHEMSRSGKPQHRRERFDAILDWHDRYLR